MDGKTVLIVDDEAAILNLVAAALNNHGYVVLKALGGHAALQIAEAHRGAVDLLLTDVRMPGLSGPELCSRLREQHPETRYLLMSGYAEGIEAWDLPLLPKPFRITDLLQTVRRTLDAADSAHTGEVLWAPAVSVSSSNR